MHKVTVDGIDYFPKTQSKIGVAVTTYNRQQVLNNTLSKILEYTPGAYVVVVDDASPVPVVVPEGVDLIRSNTNSGIAESKNKCIEALVNHGCDELFLFDDDAFPLKDGWWEPYVNSPEPHLMYMFEDVASKNKLRDVKVLYEDDSHRAFSGPRGVMLYVNRSVIDIVGGMDLVYGRWGYEHGDWSNRIHHEGLTSWRYADVVGSHELIYSLDEHEEVQRSVGGAERTELAKKNAIIHNERMKNWYKSYCDFRAPKRVVITSLLTSTKDPQRGSVMRGDLGMIKTWAESIKGATPVVIVDHDVDSLPGVEIVKVPPSPMNLYYRRWLLAYQYLRDNSDITQAWVTDGTDVVMLRSPWDGMETNKVYVGSEPKTLDDVWMKTNHKSEFFQEFLNANYDKPMLNAGLLGGSRLDVMLYAHTVFRQWAYLDAMRFWGKDKSEPEMGDMAAFNLSGYTQFSDRIVFGPRVHTVFRAEEKDNTWAWFKHK